MRKKNVLTLLLLSILLSALGMVVNGETTTTYNLEYLDWDGTVLQSETYFYQDDLSGVSAPMDPVRDSYIFVGWDSVVPDSMPENDVYIYAVYKVFSDEHVVSSTVDGPYCAYPADLDNDGDMDIIAGINMDNEIVWFENNGDGTFGQKQVISVLVDDPRSVSAADLDNDGDLDVISSNYGDGKIAWYENNGDGTFGLQQVISTLANKTLVVSTADLDNDGDMDIFSTSYMNDKLAWYENNGDGTFGLQQVIASAAGDSFAMACASDIDNDGDVDIVKISYVLNTIEWFENNGDGTFGTVHLIANSINVTTVYTADFDNDGDQDVLSLSEETQELSWYMNNGDGTFGTEQVIGNNNSNVNVVSVADFNNDGDIDIMYIGYLYSNIYWLENNGDGTFSDTQVIAENVNDMFVVCPVDIDNDGDFDVLTSFVGGDRIVWFENIIEKNEQRFEEKTDITSAINQPESVYAADLDNDGDMDVLSASSFDNKIAWYENNGDGTFGLQQVITTLTYGAMCVYAEDLDNDGDMDVLSSSTYDDTIAWYENNGDGTFGAQQILSTNADQPYTIFAIDLDNDGDADVLSASYSDNKIAWYENNGDGTFEAEQIISTIVTSAYAVYAADLDNDGDADVLSGGVSDHKIAWYENNGDGTFGAQQVISLDVDGVFSIFATDLDNDGDIDVLSASFFDNKIAWYENNGDGTFGLQQILSTSVHNPKSVLAADIDNDGDMDVLSGSSSDDTITWYENNGDGTFGLERDISTSADGVSTVCATDIDNDGDIDVLSANSYSDTITLYENVRYITYSISYIDVDGTVLKTDNYEEGTDLNTAIAPSDPIKAGYIFSGWDTILPDTMPANDVTITATWTINNYDVVFDANNGTGTMENLSIEYNNNQYLTENTFTRDGYLYTFWNTAADGTGDVYYDNSILTMNMQGITLYAQWRTNSYYITFDLDGGYNQGNPTVYNIETETITLSVPFKTGYMFDGWFDAETGGNEVTTINKGSMGDITLFARWIIEVHTITFDSAGGTEVASITQNYGTEIIPPMDPTKEGYTFNGWDKVIPETMLPNDITIYAYWICNNYTITFDSAGGSLIDPITREYTTEITAPDEPVKDGYTFIGWDVSVPSTMPSHDVTITAIWEINDYTITFDSVGGTEVSSITLSYNSTIIAPSDPTKEGYTFLGWISSLPETMPSHDVAVSAMWSISKYTITFDTTGGTGVDSITQEYATTVTTPSDPSREGYTFNGWDVSIPTIMPLNDITITATWVVEHILNEDSVVSDVEGLETVIGDNGLESQDVEIILDINIKPIDEVSDVETALIDSTIAATIDGKTGCFDLDISLYYEVNGIQNIISETENLITVTISIPEEYQGHDEYYVIRVHEGVSKVLDTVYDMENQTLTFQTDRFSTYSIAFGMNSSGWMYLLLLLVIPVVYVIYRYIKNH